MSTTNHVTRLAPSPTGTLHLCNLRTFFINWALARLGGWKFIIRIKGLDRTRVRPGAEPGKVHRHDEFAIESRQ